jgi:hypothetical protein
MRHKETGFIAVQRHTRTMTQLQCPTELMPTHTHMHATHNSVRHPAVRTCCWLLQALTSGVPALSS